MIRSLLTLVAVLLALVLVPAIALLAYSSWQDFRFARRSPIAASQGGKITDESVEFRKKVLERFPVGSPSGELAKSLADQGFTPQNDYGDDVHCEDDSQCNWLKNASGVVWLTPGPDGWLVTRTVWSVAWKSNDAGHIVNIYAERHAIWW